MPRKIGRSDAGQLNLHYLHLLRCIYFLLNVGSDLYTPYEEFEEENEKYEDLGKVFGQEEEPSKEGEDDEKVEDVNVVDKFGLVKKR